MEEGSKVRLVRCPKCENLLPELPDYSVYECGGCGAVLRANKMGPVSDCLSDKSDDERARGGFKKGNGVSLSASETESDGLERGRKKERVLSERTVNLISSSSSRTENREAAGDFDRNVSRETMNLRVDRSTEDGEYAYYDDRYRRSSKRPSNNWVRGNDDDMNLKRSEFVNSRMENQLEKLRPTGDVAGSSRSRPIMDQWSTERNGSVAFRVTGRGVTEQGRFSTFPYPNEGPSNYNPGFFHGYCEQNRICDELDRPNRVENLEHDRAELLRKLDELKDQLSRSCDVAEKPKERVPVGRTMAPPPPPTDTYGGHDVYMPEGPTSLYSVNMQPFARDKLVPEPPYFNHSHGPVPYINSHGSDVQDFYPPPRNVPNDFPGYEDPYLPPRFRRPPHQPRQYLKEPYHNPCSGQYMDLNQVTIASHPHETFFHRPACSCLHCYNKNWQVPPKVPPPVFSSRSALNDPTNPIFHQHVNPVTYGPTVHNSRGANPPQLHAQERQPQTISSSVLHSETAGFARCHPRRVVIAHCNRHVCHPIAGGAPFITCYNCFESLKLPRKLMVMGENQQKVRCGACSSIILFELEKKGIAISISEQIKQASAKVHDISGETLNESLQSSHGYLNAGITNSCSDDYDNPSYNFQLMDTGPNILPRDQKSNFSDSSNRQDPLSPSSSFSEDEQSPNGVIVGRDVSGSAQQPSEDDLSLALPDSPLQNCPDYSPPNNGVSRYGKGNKSEHNDQEKVIVDRSTSRQNSVQDASAATEMEVTFNEYLNSGVSHDYTEVSKDEDQPRINKGRESFFAGLIKKSFRDFSRNGQSVDAGRSNISVNGQRLPSRVVKKAEKSAGPIQPGEYWYDFRAGFWGVMGQPCLGIIPPFIEEFDYPMPQNCAAGNTGVFINGRELHQKDLDLLAGRGLPTTRDKSYIIEISGRVLDEDTGEELDSLGKLAPTVERVKHGFGMKVPRAIAQ